MRFDLSDLDRLTGFADALERLFWCLIAVGFITAILGSPGTGLFVLVLGAAGFVVRVGLEDFVRSRGKEPVASRKTPARKNETITKRKAEAESEREPEREFTVYRASRRPRRTKSAV
jgi:hypothetical protein